MLRKFLIMEISNAKLNSMCLYDRLKKKKMRIILDISFLTKCRKQKIFPKFLSLKSSTKTKTSNLAIKHAKITWLKMEIREKHKILDNIEKLLYVEYKKLAHFCKNDLYFQMFYEQKQQQLLINLDNMFKKIKYTHHKKFKSLLQKQKSIVKNKPQFIPDFVVNLSKEVLKEEELNFLNKGLKFAITPTHIPMNEIIVNIESGIEYFGNNKKASIRQDIEKCLIKSTAIVSEKKNFVSNNLTKGTNVLKNLKQKEVIYSKADKGNAVVVMDKSQYDNKVLDMINKGPYEELKFANGKSRNPLNTMVQESIDCAKNISNILDDKFWNLKFKVSNPRVGILYALPKIHKDPIAMRPIVSNNNVPMEKQSEWLVNILKSYDIDIGFSIKNTMELAKKLENVKIKKGEVMGSFDIVNMYPNVPADLAIQSMENFLKRKEAPEKIIKACVLIAKTTMNQNYFQFRGKYYKQHFGLSMGSKISPYLANIFFCELEDKLKNHPLFPKVWVRYVDDIFVVIKERYVHAFMVLLNSLQNSIKFTFEKESERRLPFLDILISRKEDGNIVFSIYRKPTHTDRYITMDSHHSGEHKQSAFHSMVHRLLNIPMEEDDFKKEKQYIYNVANINGFDKQFINKIINKQKNKINLSQITKLESTTNPTIKYISVPFCPRITNSLRNVLKKHDIRLVTKSMSTLRNILCNYKDKVPQLHQAGIYVERCLDCQEIYIGQTRRKLEERHNEHIRAIKYNFTNKSAVAEHMLQQKHNLDCSNFAKLKTVHNSHHLNAWESLYIFKSPHALMNRDQSPIISNLFKFGKVKF